MAQLLADENVPGDVVVALRSDGHDVTWMRDIEPSSPEDFGELAFRSGQRATPGVILLRPRLRSPGHLVRLARAVLAEGHPWEGHFAVAEEGRIRLVPLPI